MGNQTRIVRAFKGYRMDYLREATKYQAGEKEALKITILAI